MKEINLNRADVSRLNDVLDKFPEIDNFTLVVEDTSGIGYTVDLKFTREEKTMRCKVVIPVTDVGSWWKWKRIAMIKLSDKLYVAKDEIVEVTISNHNDRILVKTKSGNVYNKAVDLAHTSIYTQLVNFVAEIEK